VAEDANKVVGNGTLAAYGAARLSTKCTAALGHRCRTARAIADERAYSPMPYGPDTGTNNMRGGSPTGSEPAIEYQ
jgi:hypothetical protein